jgi:transcriptional regulator with GAF, ATPase, and Fis domain
MIEDRQSKNRVLINGVPTERASLSDGDLIELGRTFFLFRQVSRAAGPIADLDGSALTDTPPALRTLSVELEHTLARLSAVARSSVAVLVRGESGTGKELAARALHALSDRKGQLVAVNCGALPSGLVESELFGHEKGAFSGASSAKLGLFRAADRGTLLLDEIGDLAPQSQAALLRALQESEVTPVGAHRAVRLDVRTVSATHRDLEAMTAAGGFRHDLLARLAGYTLSLPPLRERLEDLGLLIGTLLERADPGRRFAIEPVAARALFQHDWPHNVRELEQALRAAAALAGDGLIRQQHLPDCVRAPRTEAAASAAPSERDRALAFELSRLLANHAGNIAGVAREMGKDRTQIRRWLKRFGIDAERFR